MKISTILDQIDLGAMALPESPEGEFSYEIIDEATGEAKAIIDLAWANGLQEGLSQPVALLIDEEKETEEVVNNAGFRFFTDFNEFQKYVKSDILAEV